MRLRERQLRKQLQTNPHDKGLHEELLSLLNGRAQEYKVAVRQFKQAAYFNPFFVYDHYMLAGMTVESLLGGWLLCVTLPSFKLYCDPFQLQEWCNAEHKTLATLPGEFYPSSYLLERVWDFLEQDVEVMDDERGLLRRADDEHASYWISLKMESYGLIKISTNKKKII